jgi:hypothetical protein
MNALEADILVELEKLRDCMLMLHKPYCVPSYHEQLCTCVFHFIGLDLTGHFRASYILGLLKLWPWLDSDKEECFLLELEELLDFMSPEEEKVSGSGAVPAARPRLPASLPSCLPSCLPC